MCAARTAGAAALLGCAQGAPVADGALASRPFARAFAVTVAVFVSKSRVFVPGTTHLA